jgi:Zn-dependent peptidase ImmA (M78 family)
MTKKIFAARIGVETRSVTAYEAGEYFPADDTLARIQALTGFTADFFHGDDIEVPSLDTASFRSLSKMLAPQRDMALGQGAIALLLNQWLEEKFDLPQSELPDLSCEGTPEGAAASLRQLWRLGELPIKNMIHLLEAKGVRVFSLSVKAREVDAFSMWKGATPFVFLNTQKTSERSRFDAAHELGHLVMHRQGSPSGREAEREANEFASAFLMPRASVLAQMRPMPTLQTLIGLKKIWTVSVAAINYRLHTLDLLTEWHFRQLCVQISKLGRDKEPEEAPRETSQLLPKMFSSLHEDGIGRSQVARELGVSVSELENLMFGLVMTSVQGGRIGEPKVRKQSVLELVKG